MVHHLSIHVLACMCVCVKQVKELAEKRQIELDKELGVCRQEVADKTKVILVTIVL